MKKVLSIILVVAVALVICACGKVDKNYGVDTASEVVESVESKSDDVSKITSLDNKMSQFFDITLFDEENYSTVFLGKDFKIKASFDGCDFSLPSKISDLETDGWKLVEGSDYDNNSLIYANETVELSFVNDNENTIIAVFYNALNSSVRLDDCNIVKLRISNGYVKNSDKYAIFNINGITNTSVITDIIQVLGTPSHFYKKTESLYYFDYFLQESDRRNKIRIYIDLTDDAITAIEFSNYLG